MKTIRPYELFDRLSDHQRTIQYRIPKGPSSGSLSMTSLETLSLVALTKIHKIDSILEIGTGFGWTAWQFAMNTPCEITTVDIENKPKIYEGYPSRIRTITRSSAYFYASPFDMVLIDGDHSYEAISRDTDLAIRCKARIIIWHDFEFSAAPDVEKYLKEVDESHLMHLTRIAETSLVFWTLYK